MCIRDRLKALTEDDFKTSFEQLEKLWKNCVAVERDYFERSKFTNLQLLYILKIKSILIIFDQVLYFDREIK